MKWKFLLALLLVVCAVVLIGVSFVPLVNADTGGNYGDWDMPHAGYITSVHFDVTVTTEPLAVDWFAYFDGNAIASGSVSGISQNIVFNQDVGTFSYAGDPHSLTFYVDPAYATIDAASAYATYTPYYYIQVSSAYGSPTISVNGGGAQSLPVYVQSGLGYVVSVDSPVSVGSGAQEVCTSSTSQSFTATADNTVSFNWQLQYQVTYSATGLDSSAQGTIVTVDSAAKAYADLPFSKWVNNGASTSFTYGSTISSSTTGKQFRLSSSVSSPQTITGPTTITDGYTIQYLLTVDANGHSSGVGGGWYDAGSTAYAYCASTQVYDGDYIRYNFASWSGSGSGSYTGSSSTATVTMNAPISETANWQTQYYLNVVGTYSSTTGTGWYNSGATANFDVSSPVSGGTGTQLAFSSWTGSGAGSYSGSTKASSCTMNAAITESANWVTQYYLTVSSLYGSTSGSGWYTSGVTAHAGLSSGTVDGGAGSQYLFVSWSVGGTNYAASSDIVMSYPVTATASWSTQFYLTVTSPYASTSGSRWYDAGTTAYAGVDTNVVIDGGGTHTLQGWSSGASGTSITSNPITMSSPISAVAVWSTTGGGGSGPVSYIVYLHGPYYEDGTAAAGQAILCTLQYANNTVYQFTMNSSVGVVTNKTVTSTSSFVQLQWNASSTLNYTRVYRFIANQTSDDVYLYIVRSTQPSFLYTFSVTDFYGMINPYLESRISPDGIHNYVVERADLSEGGTVTFVMTQYQMYSLAFVCSQGTYTQSFTAQIQGTPGQYPVSLNVLAGNFPAINSTSGLFVEAARLNSTAVSVSYNDPSNTTSWVYVRIYHLQGTSEITDYVVNSSGSVQLFLWQLADSQVNYYVYVESLVGGESTVWNLVAGTSVSLSNPFLGVLDFLGQSTATLPFVQTGWPMGMSSAQIAELVGACVVMLFLCVGSFRSAGACCILSWLIFGVLAVLGWFGVVTPYMVPMFAISGFVALIIAIDEGKSQVREV